MRLSKFITENIEEILVEWESFAKTIQPAAETMDSLTLRDHAKLILEAAAKDINIHQTDRQQSDKSKGLADPLVGKETAATTHGALRQIAGFDLEQLGSEYRALRASVIRLWKSRLTKFDETEFDDMMRFNEAIDQALAESISSYSSAVDQSRQTFLAILGHDLRGPLSAIQMASQILIKSETLDAQYLDIAARIKRSVSTMNRMIKDLLEFAGEQIGKKIPIKPEPANLESVSRTSVDEVQLAHPKAVFNFEMTGNLDGYFDPARFQQVLSNLLINAAKYSEEGKQVTLSGRRDGGTIIVEVKNFGRPIPPESLQVIFNPLVQLPVRGAHSHPSTSLGLGLFIAREIVEGHNGTIEVSSSETDGTVFTVRLPQS
ncbi:MAG: HAMP domain-containing histidine kinase [Acidobacteriota bacterium]|nr:HAMP domain-containing histidine kinase [Acidobacteriota bacterium]